jgi:hypothetical protein
MNLITLQYLFPHICEEALNVVSSHLYPGTGIRDAGTVSEHQTSTLTATVTSDVFLP